MNIQSLKIKQIFETQTTINQKKAPMKKKLNVLLMKKW